MRGNVDGGHLISSSGVFRKPFARCVNGIGVEIYQHTSTGAIAAARGNGQVGNARNKAPASRIISVKQPYRLVKLNFPKPEAAVVHGQAEPHGQSRFHRRSRAVVHVGQGPSRFGASAKSWDCVKKAGERFDGCQRLVFAFAMRNSAKRCIIDPVCRA